MAETTESEPSLASDEAYYRSDIDLNTKADEEIKMKPEVRKESKPEEEAPIPMVLEPDHPMMERFQAALKNHLLKQIDRLSNQVCDLNNQIQAKEKEKEETGLQLYTMQQEMYRQQKTLEDCENTIESLTKERESLDESVRSKKMNWKEQVDCLNCAKKKESDMIAEFQKLSNLEKQMEKWEKEMESELTVSQRISEKTQYDKNKLIDEKRKMDMYLLRLMTAVSNYESEIRLLEGEIDVKLEEKDSLNQTLADAAADLQALVTEQKRLLAAWNSVVSTINHRNLLYVTVSKELTNSQEAFRSLNTEIESYKRSSMEEMKKSEKLAIILGRVQNDFESSETSLKNLLSKKTILEDKISYTASMIQRADADLVHAKMETEKTQTALTAVRNCFEKLAQEKRQLEDEAMNFLQEQMFNNKTAMHLNKLMRDLREKARKQEFGAIEIENKISQKFLEVEELKEIIFRNNEIIKEMNNELNVREEELKKYQDEILKCHAAAIQKQGNFAILVRKIEKLQETSNYGKHIPNPLQARISELEKANVELQAKNDKMQNYWLLQQTNNVKLTQQRNDQIKDMSLIRRQVLLLEKRAIKIDVEYEREKKIEHNVNKSIMQLQHRLTVLNDVLVGKKGYKENLGKENSFMQTQFLQNLKDSELEQIRLKQEIKELEGNLEELAETMLGVQREMLAWEKKIQSAVEAKNDMQKERSSSGETGQMKAEIHRMEVRYAQLKRAQEKLVNDLEQCVLRRDAIADGADAMEKRQAKNFNTRFMFQKKLENLRNNIRAIRNKIKQVEKIIENTEEGQKELKKAIAEKEAELLQMEETTKKIYEQLEEGKLQKCRNLEMIIRKQKKSRMYESLKSGKHRMLFKSDEVLEKELQKQKNTNANLVTVMETLINDFPGYNFQLKKILNTFRAKPS